MANPNIISANNIYGGTDYLTPSSTSTVVLLANAASSSKVYKIESIIAVNSSTGSAANANVAIYTNGSVAQGSAPSGGTAYPIASSISVPAAASMVITDKTTSFYLKENTSVTIATGTANILTFVIAYEDIS
jgi:hypothetical protein